MMHSLTTAGGRNMNVWTMGTRVYSRVALVLMHTLHDLLNVPRRVSNVVHDGWEILAHVMKKQTLHPFQLSIY